MSETEKALVVAKLSSNQSVSATVLTDVQFATEVVDAGNNFDPSTYEFTAPEDGIYLLLISLYSNAQPSDSQLGMLVKKNGASFVSQSYQYGGGGGALTVNLHDAVKLDKGDTIKVQEYSDDNVTLNADNSRLIIMALAALRVLC